MTKSVAIGVCHGPRCMEYGGQALAEILRGQYIEVEALGCQSLCSYFPIVRLNERVIHRASMDRVMKQLCE
ncbi:MAG: (2Fe-2S) ferredoxin domain-containing protein [Mariprofundus sp.]|nr:(2Fe-2S) ferredoxin domain-containing protein [Mariprofundus sp.]